jgi:hypothetical protein
VYSFTRMCFELGSPHLKSPIPICTAILQPHLLPLSLPIIHMSQNNLTCLFRTMLSSNRLHEIPLGIHQIEINTMIYQIILSLLDALGRTKIHAIFLTDVFDLVPGPCQTYERGMEFREVGVKNRRGVAGGIAGDEDGEEGRSRGAARGRGGY